MRIEQGDIVVRERSGGTGISCEPYACDVLGTLVATSQSRKFLVLNFHGSEKSHPWISPASDFKHHACKGDRVIFQDQYSLRHVAGTVHDDWRDCTGKRWLMIRPDNEPNCVTKKTDPATVTLMDPAATEPPKAQGVQFIGVDVGKGDATSIVEVIIAPEVPNEFKCDGFAVGDQVIVDKSRPAVIASAPAQVDTAESAVWVQFIDGEFSGVNKGRLQRRVRVDDRVYVTEVDGSRWYGTVSAQRRVAGRRQVWVTEYRLIGAFLPRRAYWVPETWCSLDNSLVANLHHKPAERGWVPTTDAGRSIVSAIEGALLSMDGAGAPSFQTISNVVRTAVARALGGERRKC